ncbi:unnamed protein product [Effrenium voratum]|nr:unnamed protein product [Effrenium voratum]
MMTEEPMQQQLNRLPIANARQNLGVLLAGQTADPVALRAVARLLGADEDFYSKTALRYLNVGKAGRHERRSLCALRAPVRAQIWRAFREEYGRLAELLGGFQLVEGSREEMLRLFQSWTC